MGQLRAIYSLPRLALSNESLTQRASPRCKINDVCDDERILEIFLTQLNSHRRICPKARNAKGVANDRLDYLRA